MTEPFPSSRIPVVSFDFVKRKEEPKRYDGPPVASRPLVHHVLPEIGGDPNVPLHIKKRQKFWKCDRDGIWRSPVMIVWYVAAVTLVLYEVWLHFRNGGDQYRHDAAVDIEAFYAAHGLLFPAHDMLVVAGTMSGWRQEHLEAPSLRDHPPDVAVAFLEPSELYAEYI